MLLGLGSRAVVKVPTDDAGAMDVAALEHALSTAVADGIRPLAVVCTAGTTVLAAFDPIAAVVAVARRFGAWVHCDAAYGGTVLWSRKHRHLMEGIQDVDSVTWNLHKMAVSHELSLTCSVYHMPSRAFTCRGSRCRVPSSQLIILDCYKRATAFVLSTCSKETRHMIQPSMLETRRSVSHLLRDLALIPRRSCCVVARLTA